MKKSVIFATFSLLACSIVLPVIRSVNTSHGYSPVPATWISEGNPMPAPIPC
jgi:hypothetical protein